MNLEKYRNLHRETAGMLNVHPIQRGGILTPEARAVLAEFGTELPAGVQIRVVDSTADLRYLVLPLRPAGTDTWSEAELAGVVTRDTMIGVTLPRAAGDRSAGGPVSVAPPLGRPGQDDPSR